MGRRCNNKWGYIAICVGVIIIMKLILPTEFWWFLFAAFLIALGLWRMKN